MQFQYADKSGKLQTIDAASQEAALSQVATLSPGSGVMPAPQNNVQTQGATQNVVQDKNPISSASYIQNQNVDKTIQSALNPQSNVKPLNDLQNRVMQFVGTTDEDYIRGLDTSTLISLDKEAESRRLAGETRTKAEQNLQTSYNQALAQQNATYANLSRDLARRRQGDVETAKATAAQLNPYSGANTAEQGYDRQINAEYDRLQGDLDTKAAAAMAALASGNAEAYAKIQQSMADDYAQSAQNVSAIMNQLQNRDLQSQQFNLSLAKESRIADTQEKKDFLDNLERFGAGIPEEDINSFLTSGSMTPAIKSIMKQGVNADFTPAEIASFIQMGTQKQRTQAFNENYKNNQLNIAMERLGLAISNANKDTAPTTFESDALQTVLDNTIIGLNITNKDQVNRIARQYQNAAANGIEGLQNEIIGFASKRGDAPSKADLNSTLKLVNQIDEISKIRNDLKTKGIATNITDGSIENLFNWLGKTKDPELATLKAQADRLTNDLVLKYAATTFTEGMYNKIKNQNPSITKEDKLNAIQEQALKSSLERDLKRNLEPLVGDYYDDIFGSKQQAAPTSGTTSGGIKYTIE